EERRLTSQYTTSTLDSKPEIATAMPYDVPQQQYSFPVITLESEPNLPDEYLPQEHFENKKRKLKPSKETSSVKTTVYEAQHKQYGPVIVKEVRFNKDQGMKQFDRTQAKIKRHLEILNDVQPLALEENAQAPKTLEVIKQGSRTYIVQEKLETPTVQEYLKQHGTLSPEQAERVIQSAAIFLDKFHRTGKLHTDISPGNVFIDEEALNDENADLKTIVQVTDFDASVMEELYEDDGFFTTHMGTKGFAAPEVLLQNTEDYGHYTDVYSLIALTAYMIRGNRHTLNNDYELKDSLLQTLPERLRNVMGKATKRRHNERYQSMQDMVLDLVSPEFDIALELHQGVTGPIPDFYEGLDETSVKYLKTKINNQFGTHYAENPYDLHGTDEYFNSKDLGNRTLFFEDGQRISTKDFLELRGITPLNIRRRSNHEYELKKQVKKGLRRLRRKAKKNVSLESFIYEIGPAKILTQDLEEAGKHIQFPTDTESILYHFLNKACEEGRKSFVPKFLQLYPLDDDISELKLTNEETEAYQRLPLTSDTAMEIAKMTRNYVQALQDYHDIRQTKLNKIEEKRQAKVAKLKAKKAKQEAIETRRLAMPKNIETEVVEAELVDDVLTKNEKAVLARDDYSLSIIGNEPKYILGGWALGSTLIAYLGTYSNVAPDFATILTLGPGAVLSALGINEIIKYKRQVLDKADVKIKEHIRKTGKRPTWKDIMDIDEEVADPLNNFVNKSIEFFNKKIEKEPTNSFTGAMWALGGILYTFSTTLPPVLTKASLFYSIAQTRYALEKRKEHKQRRLTSSENTLDTGFESQWEDYKQSEHSFISQKAKLSNLKSAIISGTLGGTLIGLGAMDVMNGLDILGYFLGAYSTYATGYAIYDKIKQNKGNRKLISPINIESIETNQSPSETENPYTIPSFYEGISLQQKYKLKTELSTFLPTSSLKYIFANQEKIGYVIDNPYEITNPKIAEELYSKLNNPFNWSLDLKFHIEKKGLTPENIETRNKHEKKLKKEIKEEIKWSKKEAKHNSIINLNEKLTAAEETLVKLEGERISIFNLYNPLLTVTETQAYEKLPLTTDTVNYLKKQFESYAQHLEKLKENKTLIPI
ncbi:MAG: protein kinase, partial [Candidatus Woesearchaeota archaeon]